MTRENPHWHLMSNSPEAGTGYGVQMRTTMQRWAKSKERTFSMTAFYGNQGAPATFENIPILPPSKHPYGLDRIGWDYMHGRSDFLFTLIDAWIYLSISEAMKQMRWVAYAPVDHDPIPSPVVDALKLAWQPIAYSRFGYEQMLAVGLPAEYIPHSIDTNFFKPVPKAEARKYVGMPDDRFAVLIVAANKGDNPPRKAWEPQLRAFAQFQKRHPEAILMLHTDLVGQGGVDIQQIISYLGIPSYAVAASDQGRMNAHLLNSHYVSMLYNAADVLMNVTMGEGFGVPIAEAQACGCPVIVGNYTSMPELVFGGWKVDKAYDYYTPQGSYQFLPSIDGMVDALEQAYQARNDLGIRERARVGIVENYDADLVNEKYWLPAFAKMEARMREETKPAELPIVITGKPRTVSIITPWRDHPELIFAYEQAVKGADEVIIVDNGSDPERALLLLAMVERLGGKYIRNGSNKAFAEANNQGLAQATGDVILFMNNDIQATKSDWLDGVRYAIPENSLVGQSKQYREVAGVVIPYLEGFCIGGTREVWQKLNGWDAVAYQGSYWEDNDLCWRAIRSGLRLGQMDLGIMHLNGGNTTSKHTPGAYDHSLPNRLTFEARVKAALLADGQEGVA